MDIAWQAVADGSVALRVTEGAVNTEYSLSLVLQPVSEDTVEVTLAHGHLTPDINILVGMKAYELGYKYLEFHAEKGTNTTRWAEVVSSDEHFDYYRVDLKEAVTRYLTEKAL